MYRENTGSHWVTSSIADIFLPLASPNLLSNAVTYVLVCFFSCPFSHLKWAIVFFFNQSIDFSFKKDSISLSLLISSDYFAWAKLSLFFFYHTKRLCFYLTFLYISSVEHLIIFLEFILNGVGLFKKRIQALDNFNSLFYVCFCLFIGHIFFIPDIIYSAEVKIITITFN